jgi:hypothetical protein
VLVISWLDGGVVGWLVCWLVRCLVSFFWLVSLTVDSMVAGWMLDAWLTDRLSGVVDWLTGYFYGKRVDRLVS